MVLLRKGKRKSLIKEKEMKCNVVSFVGRFGAMEGVEVEIVGLVSSFIKQHYLLYMLRNQDLRIYNISTFVSPSSGNKTDKLSTSVTLDIAT